MQRLVKLLKHPRGPFYFNHRDKEYFTKRLVAAFIKPLMMGSGKGAATQAKVIAKMYK